MVPAPPPPSDNDDQSEREEGELGKRSREENEGEGGGGGRKRVPLFPADRIRTALQQGGYATKVLTLLLQNACAWVSQCSNLPRMAGHWFSGDIWPHASSSGFPGNDCQVQGS